MKKLIHNLLGDSPKTTLLGYSILGLTVVNESIQKGETRWFPIAIAVLVALMGRYAADATETPPPAE